VRVGKHSSSGTRNNLTFDNRKFSSNLNVSSTKNSNKFCNYTKINNEIENFDVKPIKKE